MKNFEKLNTLQKKDFTNLEAVCINMRENGCSYYDVMNYLSDYIAELSETVNLNYFKAVNELKDYYYDRWIKRELKR